MTLSCEVRKAPGLTLGQARKLKIGDELMWDNDPTITGKVTETGYCAVKIAWSDGQLGVVHHRDFEKIQRAPR